MDQAIAACKCWGSGSEIDFSSGSCNLRQENNKVFCKDSATSECSNAIAELANAYQKADNAKDEDCYDKDPGYKGTKEAAAHCKGD